MQTKHCFSISHCLSQYNFQGKYDVVRFIKLIEKKGMYATLRIGPYIEAEWNYG